MPLTDIDKLKEYVKQRNLREKDERNYLVEHLLGYREMNDVICRQKRLPRIEDFNDGSLLVSCVEWIWDREKLTGMSVDELRTLSKRAESWDRFIHHCIEDEK